MEMLGVFTWLNKQGVRSPAGFEAQRIDRFTIQYREGKRFVNVYVEPGLTAGKPSVSISGTAFETWDNSTVANSTAEQDRMRRNFVAAMEFQGIEVDG